jgi:uncharacterized OsmC-like protein
LASVTVTYLPGTAYQTRIDTGNVAIVGDEPASSGGDGLGPSPYELLLGALGHCTVLTMLLYARRKEWGLSAISIKATHERLVTEEDINGEIVRRKVERIVQEISLEGALDAEQRARLMEIAGKCPVHRTLTGDLEIVEVEAVVRGPLVTSP